MKFLHIITNLENGGAEGVLYRLCTYDRNPSDHTVISLLGAGKYARLLEESQVQVYYLNLKFNGYIVRDFFRLIQLIKTLNPTIIQTWMYHADFIGGLAAWVAGFPAIYWNIRNSNLDFKHSKLTTIIIAKCCALLSYFIPKKIICCSDVAKKNHISLGYQAKKITIISNGYDFSQFKPNVELRKRFRDDLGTQDTVAIGMVARYDPQKDHAGLLEALRLVQDNKGYSFKAYLIGTGLTPQNTSLTTDLVTRQLGDSVTLLGPRSDISAVMNGLDIHVLSSSYGEAFPNVVAEAMACGTPCISTDVGDASLIIAGTGWVVPPNDPHALSLAIMEAMDEYLHTPEKWIERKISAEKHVHFSYPIDKMIQRYYSVWGVL